MFASASAHVDAELPFDGGEAALERSVDLIVSSAGVSVGAYDVVKAVLEE